MPMMQNISFSHAKQLAEKLGVQHVSAFEQHKPNDGLFNPAHTNLYHHYQFIPYALINGKLLIATSSPSVHLQSLLQSLYGTNTDLVIASTRDITHWISIRAATTHTRLAVLALRSKFRDLCADRTLMPRQLISLLWPVIVLAIALLLASKSSTVVIIALCNAFYLASLTFKFIVYKTWQRVRMHQRPELRLPEDNDLPIYTLFVPVYREPQHVLRQLITALERLDYPEDKKDVLLICESDDTDTIDALKALAPPSFCRIIRVPASYPRTKPKALNVALQFARGEFAVIFDAEDIPDPLQLKKAVARFTHFPDVACLQAPLAYYNRSENLLTKLFSIEYSTLFRLQLPALEALRMPIPLGGTSNHLRTKVLRELCGWDAFNVTEDADLGMRLSLFGYHIQLLDSVTMEEAPIGITSWLHQRSRWIKGYIQTWLVYMRNPRKLKQSLGLKAYYGFQFFIGAPALTFIIAPFFWCIFLLSQTGYLGVPLPEWLNILSLLCLIWGMYSHWLYAKAAIILEGWQNMRLAAALYPLYWFLHVIASFMALFDMFRRPHGWRKTSHGVSRMFSS